MHVSDKSVYYTKFSLYNTFHLLRYKTGKSYSIVFERPNSNMIFTVIKSSQQGDEIYICEVWRKQN